MNSLSDLIAQRKYIESLIGMYGLDDDEESHRLAEDLESVNAAIANLK